jgi:hypothetical protein
MACPIVLNAQMPAVVPPALLLPELVVASEPLMGSTKYALLATASQAAHTFAWHATLVPVVH